jgi:hypothetical protein
MIHLLESPIAISHPKQTARSYLPGRINDRESLLREIQELILDGHVGFLILV